jgi:hypothetical protein
VGEGGDHEALQKWYAVHVWNGLQTSLN